MFILAMCILMLSRHGFVAVDAAIILVVFIAGEEE
jgi:hypothetical protein